MVSTAGTKHVLRYVADQPAHGLSIRFLSIFLLYSLSYGEVYGPCVTLYNSAPHGYCKCTATHGTPRGTHEGPRGVVQQIPKVGYNIQGGF